MTLDEAANLATCRPDSKPVGFGRTILARAPEGADAGVVMERIRGAWAAIAKWGRWGDEDLGEWPPAEECLGQLPAWLQEAWKHEPPSEIESWMDDLHDREWIWWSGAALDHLLKIDLSSDGLPISTWTIEFVVGKAGAVVVHRGEWLASTEAISLLGVPA